MNRTPATPPAFMVARMCAAAFALALSHQVQAMALQQTSPAQSCPADARSVAPLQPLPVQAGQRIAESQVSAGRMNVAWAWLGSPTLRYPHRALGSPTHAGSVHALVKARSGTWQPVELRLPLSRVYEDRVPRIVDLDRDGSEEIVLVEADLLRGAALVVLGVEHTARGPELIERARSTFAGTAFRWLNPVGVADFDADGHLDLAMVRTPHIGGELQLLHYRPPELVPYARALDVSNHRMGALEQELAVIVPSPGQRPTILLPDMSLRAVHALRWDPPGRWTEMHDALPLKGRVERLTPLPGGACVWFDDGSTQQLMLVP